MSDKSMLKLEARARLAKGKKNQALRQQGMIPAILYGHGVKNIELAIDYRNFEKVYKQAGGSSLVDLAIKDQKPVKVIIQEVQTDPKSGRFIHIDLHQVKMTEKISAEVNLNFVGESKAVKEQGGILVKILSKLYVECLPQDLVHEIQVDISSLQTFDDDIRVKNLKVPQGLTVKENPKEVVATVQPPRSDEELKALEEKPEEKVEEITQVEKKKKEEVTAEESASAAEVAPQTKTKEEKK